MRGLAAVPYCTPEGGSGYIPDAYAPTLSTFVITQDSPVYDQTTGWLRQQWPGTFTNYPDFIPAGFPPVPERACGVGDLYLRRDDVVAPMPSMTGMAAEGCTVPQQVCQGGLTGFVAEHPWVALGVLLGGAFLLWGKK